MLAHSSQDAALLLAFQHGIDLHIRTAARVLSIAEADVTDQQRSLGKTLNFGIVYGQTAYGLADDQAMPGLRKTSDFRLVLAGELGNISVPARTPLVA